MSRSAVLKNPSLPKEFPDYNSKRLPVESFRGRPDNTSQGTATSTPGNRCRIAAASATLAPPYPHAPDESVGVCRACGRRNLANPAGRRGLKDVYKRQVREIMSFSFLIEMEKILRMVPNLKKCQSTLGISMLGIVSSYPKN